RAVIGGCKGVFNPHRDAALPHRLHRGRVQHLGPEVRQFHRLLVADARDGPGRPHQARVGGEHAAHVGPNFQLLRAQRGSQNSGRVVGAAAAQRGSMPLPGRGFIDLGHPKARIGADELPAVGPGGGDAPRLQGGYHQAAAQQLAVAHESVESARRKLAERKNAVGQQRQLGKLG
nr:hypothetical protein [Tanacetum cinerariifolium]